MASAARMLPALVYARHLPAGALSAAASAVSEANPQNWTREINGTPTACRYLHRGFHHQYEVCLHPVLHKERLPFALPQYKLKTT